MALQMVCQVFWLLSSGTFVAARHMHLKSRVDSASLVQKLKKHQSNETAYAAYAAYTFVPPIRRQVVANQQTLPGYVLEFRRGKDVTTFECIAQGGKISAFKFNGENIILNVATGSSAVWGSTFWSSPQSDWGWPPPDAFETHSYSVEVDEDGMAVTLRGDVDEKLGMSISKRFSVDLHAGAIVLKYTIHRSTSSGPESLAPWEITRLGPKGMTFYPSGPPPSSTGGFEPLPVREKDGVTWFNHEAPKLSSNKLIANSAGNWYAFTNGHLGFVKRFDHIQPQDRAPHEGQIEIYSAGSYVEMENQGAFRKTPLSYTVRWFLRPLPQGMATEGNPELVKFVERL